MAGPAKCANGYCEIPAGTFKMGSINGDPDEQPVKTVTMTGFQLGQTEVSVGAYRAFLAKIAETPLNMLEFAENQKGDNFPVVGLDFYKKRAFCQFWGGDLPTAAQLHFASRYDQEDISADQLIILDNGFHSTEPVDAGKANRFGIYNLLGNVWESALDAYDQDFYAQTVSQDPYNPMYDPFSPKNIHDIIQWAEISGGSWHSSRWAARVANRDNDNPDNNNNSVGFRCARPLTPGL